VPYPAKIDVHIDNVIPFPSINHQQAWGLFKSFFQWMTEVQGFTIGQYVRLSQQEQLEWLYTWNAEAAEKLRVYLHAVNQ
jgi:hypothetical protein